MKLILTADVDHLGGVGETVEVKDGYGRNFLLPRGLAIVASLRCSEAGGTTSVGPARPSRCATSSTPTKSKPRSRLGAVALAVKTAGDSASCSVR